MATAAAEIGANRRVTLARLAVAQGGGASVFPRADLALTGPEGEDEPEAPDLPALWEAGRRRDMAAGRTLAGPHRSDLRAIYAAKGVAADQCSTGEQKALLISLILANARALRTDLARAPVLLLDEVAAHLDESRRAALYDEICALGAQALMTGTEAALFQALGGRGRVISVRDEGGESRIEA
jgi:DNA replication and repair protein RecF